MVGILKAYGELVFPRLLFQLVNGPVPLPRSIRAHDQKPVFVSSGYFATPGMLLPGLFQHGFETAPAEQDVIQMNMQLLPGQYLQPDEERLFAFALDRHKKPRPFLDSLRRHSSADMEHGPRFAGQVFSHQAGLASQSLDFARTVNARGLLVPIS